VPIHLGSDRAFAAAAGTSSQMKHDCPMCEAPSEYTPSRRSNAPIWPLWVQVSASFKMRSFSDALKIRRDAFGTTPGPGEQEAGGLGNDD
jgi:hypothetical protein